MQEELDSNDPQLALRTADKLTDFIYSFYLNVEEALLNELDQTSVSCTPVMMNSVLDDIPTDILPCTGFWKKCAPTTRPM